MRALLLGLSIAGGLILGRAVLVQPVARLMAYDPNEYCEELGVYYRDPGDDIRILSTILPQITLIDYSPLCNIHTLPVDELLSFPAIKQYGVTHGAVKEIPPNIDTLTTLTRLQVQDQEVQTIPASIGNLRELRVLKLGGNNITRLPSSIGNLTNLTSLLIYDNRLTSLPDSIGNLKSLTLIDARANRLTTLPDSIGTLKDTLKTLYLGDNPISEGEKNRIRTMLPQTEIYF